jgi:ATP-dependent DNA helicase RecG
MTGKELINIIQQGETENIEFKQTFSKSVIETLVAFSNTKGGKVLIGINDKKEVRGVTINEETVQKWVNEIKQSTNPEVVPSVESVFYEKKNIVVFTVIEYPIKPVSYRNRYFKRVVNSNHLMSIAEVANEHLRTINSSWDYYTDPNHSLEHISIKKVEKYMKEYESKNDVVIDYGPVDFLKKQEIIKDNKLTFGAYLLFAKDLCIISDVQVGRFKGKTKIIDSISLDTDLFTELNEILKFIKKNLMLEFIITGDAERKERYDYPLSAIREVVVNMLIHRDYRDPSGSLIKIYDDRITFYNPGKLFGGITIKDLLSDNFTSKPRNKLIAKAFREIRRIERYGSGISRIIKQCKEHGIAGPKFEELADGFMVTLYNKKVGEKVGERVGERVGENLTDNQKLIIKFISENNKISAKKLSEKIGISDRKIEENIRKLKQMKILKRIGSARNGHWEVIKNH